MIIELDQAGGDPTKVAQTRRQGGRKHCIALAEKVKSLFKAAGMRHSLPRVAREYPGPAPSFEPECPEADELRQELERSKVQINWVKQPDKAALVYKALLPSSSAKKSTPIYARHVSRDPQARPPHQLPK